MQNYIDDEKLISLVQNNESLYNNFSSVYKMAYAKDAIWRKIANELGATEEQCRRRWTTLRDHYARECRRLQMPSESGAHSIERWHLFDALDFLKSHVKARRTLGTSNICLEFPNTPPPELDALHFSKTFDEVPSSPLATMPSQPQPSMPQNNSPPEENLPPDTPSTPNVGKKRKNPSNVLEKDFQDAVFTLKRMCTSREARAGNEAVYGFGKMICGVICDMSTEKQIRAMQRVTEIVMKIRLEPEN